MRVMLVLAISFYFVIESGGNPELFESVFKANMSDRGAGK